MVNVRNLKKSANRKGAPPPQSTASQNLAKPGIAPGVSGVCRRTRYRYERALCRYVGIL
jgi:hypothetical protein